MTLTVFFIFKDKVWLFCDFSLKMLHAIQNGEREEEGEGEEEKERVAFINQTLKEEEETTWAFMIALGSLTSDHTNVLSLFWFFFDFLNGTRANEPFAFYFLFIQNGSNKQ